MAVTTPTEGLLWLHRHEQDLRAKSLAAVQADEFISDHWAFLAEVMNAIYAFTHDHPHGSENELTLQYLGIRLFNAGGASIKLALSGYYQKAFHQLRDIIETHFLVDYLMTYPEKIDQWRRASEKERKGRFGPKAIRDALDKRDGFPSAGRKSPYDEISELASHATYSRIALMTTGPHSIAQVGPFFDKTKLGVWSREIASRLSLPALVLLRHPEGLDPKLSATKKLYIAAMLKWWSKYQGLDLDEVIRALSDAKRPRPSDASRRNTR
jgi:hypothetical protein